MKKIYQIILFIFLSAGGFSQTNLTGYEYWFNSDYDDRQKISVPAGEEHSLTDDIDVSHLPEGLNRFTIRYKDENGIFSSSYTRNFIKHTLNELSVCEYWFDDDYAGRQQIAFAPDLQHQFSADIDVSQLTAGIHVFHIRYKGDNGFYSSMQSKTFLHIPENKQLTYFEYWFNDDFENRTGRALTPASQFQTVEDLDISNLNNGLNTISFRTKDNFGFYSSPTTIYFYKDDNLLDGPPDLTAYEYWFNNDYENRMETAFTPAEGQLLLTSVDAAALPEGVNVFNIRFKDEQGTYSITQSDIFYRKTLAPLTANNMVAYEYWFNNDYENRMETAFTPAEGQRLTTSFDAAALPEGVNVFNIRFKDEQGTYSATQSDIFYRKTLAPLTANNMVAYEYWFNNDYENRMETAFTPAEGQRLTTSFDAAALPEGVNVFNIRFKDEQGVYSVAQSQVFYKNSHAGLHSNKIYAYKYRIDDENGLARGGDPLSGYTLVTLSEPVNPALIDLDIDMSNIPKGSYLFLFSSLDSLGLWSATTTDTIVKTAFPVALFEPENDPVCSNTPVRFINQSIDADTCLWDFGDGHTSNEYEPEHIFESAGEYLVFLTVTDTISGRESTISRLIVINPEYNIEARKAICIDSVYQFGTQLITEAGVYEEMFQSVHGCDSLVNLTVQTVPGNMEVSNRSILPAGNECFNGFYTITVAGDGYPVIVESGAMAEFIAGQSILFKPGFHAQEGSNVSAYITTDGQYCVEAPAAIVAQQQEEQGQQNEEKAAAVVTGTETAVEGPQTMLVYPNPNSGVFTVKFSHLTEETQVMLFNSIGQMIFNQTTTDPEVLIDLPGITSGMYIVKAINRNNRFDQKIIVK